MMGCFRLILFIVINVSLLSCNSNSVSKIMKSNDVEYKLRMAEQFYANKKYSKAQLLFEELFQVFRSDPRFEDLYYKYAYCAFHMKDYMNAENLFKGFLEVFPKSANASEADFMHAFCFYKQSPKVELEQTNTQKTIGFMQSHINNFPESARLVEAQTIIQKCYEKLEQKEFKSSELYYNIGSYKAAAISFSNLLNHYPDSKRGDEYKLMIIKSYFQYALMSIEVKQKERFEKVVEEYYDFLDRYPESIYIKEAQKYFHLSQNNLKIKTNEPIDKKS